MKQKIFRILADLRFSIFILLLISFCSIIGTVIEQDQSIETYKLNYPLTKPIFGPPQAIRAAASSPHLLGGVDGQMLDPG